MSITLTYSTSADDCWASLGSGFDDTGTFLYIGGTSALNQAVRAWIPFSLLIPKNTVVISATLKVVASHTRSDAVLLGMHCEAADNPAAPTTRDDLLGRTLSTAYTEYSPAAYTAGTEYTYDVTNSVQETINRAGWASGNTLAVIINAPNPSGSDRRQIASYENTSYTEPKLVVVVKSPVARAGGMF